MSAAGDARWAGLIDALPTWLPQARWCGGTRAAACLRLADACVADGVAVALIDVADGDGGPSRRYVVPASLATGADAACSTAFATWLLGMVAAGRAASGMHGVFVGHPVGSPLDAPAASSAEPLGADASNTSCRVRAGAADLVVKILRHARAGTQPEVEIGGFFTATAAFASTPRLRGWLEYRPADGGPATALATLHDHLPGCASAWEVLGSLVRGGGLTGPCGDRAIALATAIGRLTAEMHAALAARPDVPGFATPAVTPAAAAALVAALVNHADDVLDLAGDGMESLPGEIGPRVRRLRASRAAIADRLREVAALLPERLIRVHGDYHLGQVLVAADDRPFVIDFEGEPGRTLAERRAPAAAAKDVAGMCHSFDYLARHAGVPDPVGTAAALTRRFLDAYTAAVAGRDWWPADADRAARLVAGLALDKALYELAYELRFRPDWAGIPLAGIEAAIG